MFKLKSAFIKLSLDKDAYREALDKRIKEIQMEGARSWLRANLDRIPVYTGTARGTFLPIGVILNVAVPIVPRVTLPGKGPDVGSTLSQFEFSQNGGIYKFTFDQSLPYFLLNEFNAIANIPSTPWHSAEYARDAYLATTQTLLSTIPNLGVYIVKTAEVQHG